MSKTCTVEGCTGSVRGHGMCSTHYKRWYRYGDPLFRKKAANGEGRKWIVARVQHSDDDCLIWPYGRTKAGYPLIGRDVYAHRLMCELVHGPSPGPKHVVAHSCGNGHLGCVNPRHLRWATQQENLSDMLLHGTSIVGVERHNAKLTEPMVREIRALRGKLPQTEIARRYGIACGHVCRIQQRKVWAWLP